MVLPFGGVILTDLRWVFMATSTPVIVPCTVAPFFSSTVTVSWLSFIKNLVKLIDAKKKKQLIKDTNTK